MSDPVLTLRDLATSEANQDQKELTKILRADAYAADLVVGGVLLGREAPIARLETAIDTYEGSELCSCGNCESAMTVSLGRSTAAFYIGLATGLRLARATDAGARPVLCIAPGALVRVGRQAIQGGCEEGDRLAGRDARCGELLL